MIPDFNEEMVKDFDIYKRVIKHENSLLKTRHFKNLKVSPWEIHIYEIIRSYTKYYDYEMIKKILNDNEIRTITNSIGNWQWDSVRDIVRRVEEHLGIESKERYFFSLRSVDYRLMMKDFAIGIKEKEPTISQAGIAEQFNIHRYPYNNPDAIGKWTAEIVRGVLQTKSKKQ